MGGVFLGYIRHLLCNSLPPLLQWFSLFCVQARMCMAVYGVRAHRHTCTKVSTVGVFIIVWE